MIPFDVILAIGQSSNDSLARAEASIADALQTLSGLGGKSE